MNLHVCSAGATNSCLGLVEAVERTSPLEGVFVHRSLDELLAVTRDIAWTDPVVLFVNTGEELDRLQTVAEELRRYRLVLIVPDDEAGHLAQGHLLRPRVLLAPPVDVEVVAAIVARMRAGSPAARIGG